MRTLISSLFVIYLASVPAIGSGAHPSLRT